MGGHRPCKRTHMPMPILPPPLLPAHVSIVAQIRLLFFPAPLLLFCVWASGTSFGSLNKATANVHKHTHTHAYLCMYVYTSVNSRRTKDSCGKPLVKSTKRIICKQKCEKGKWFTLSIDIKQFGCLSMTVLGPRPCPQTRPSTRLLTSSISTSTSTLTSVICVCAHISCFDSLCLVWFGFLQYYKV